MNSIGFISRRIFTQNKQSFSNTVIKIAIVNIALGIAVLVVSFSILYGYKNNIQDKIFSFSGHLLVSKYDNNNAVEFQAVNRHTSLDTAKLDKNLIKHVQVFANKAALLKTGKDVAGVVLKGIDKGFDTTYFSKNIKEGRFIRYTDSANTDVVISRFLSKQLRLKTGDSFVLFFIQNPPRFRKMTITGIYETELEEFDQTFIIGDLRLVQQVNNWPDSLVGGYEIFTHHIDDIDVASGSVYENMSVNMQIERITDKYMQLFDWFQLLDRNVLILVLLIAIVASFNVVTSLFILIIEKTNFIGLMKALGASNKLIRSIFLQFGRRIILTGMLIGNVIGGAFCYLQYHYKLIKLDAANYYMDSVPIYWDWSIFIIINVCMFILIAIVLLIPTAMITKVSPIKAIKFD